MLANTARYLNNIYEGKETHRTEDFVKETAISAAGGYLAGKIIEETNGMTSTSWFSTNSRLSSAYLLANDSLHLAATQAAIAVGTPLLRMGVRKLNLLSHHISKYVGLSKAFVLPEGPTASICTPLIIFTVLQPTSSFSNITQKALQAMAIRMTFNLVRSEDWGWNVLKQTPAFLKNTFFERVRSL